MKKLLIALVAISIFGCAGHGVNVDTDMQMAEKVKGRVDSYPNETTSATADEYLFWDDSASAVKNITYGNLAAQVVSESIPSAITDHSIVRGDGGAKAVQDSGIIVDDSDNATGVNSVTLNPITAPSHSEGLFFYDSVNKTISLFNDEVDVTLQLGQEMFIRVYNDSGADIDNGDVCYLSGVFSGFPTIDLAQSDAAATSLTTIGIATHDIENGTYGYITGSGTVRDVNTSGFTTADTLYLSAVTPGGIVNVAPSSPNYIIGLGQAVVIDGSAGTLQANIAIGTNTADVIKIFNGAVLEDTATTVSSNGTVVTLSYEQSGGGDLSLFFDSTFDAFDATPAATIALTDGSDISPTLNYIYIPQSTMVLTKSTTSFPAAQHVPVATILVQSAASVQTDGLYKLHAWTDHLSDSNDQGHLSHVNKWIRNQSATWLSGNVPTTTITVNGGSLDNIDFAITAGVVQQLHPHTMPAIDTGTTGHVYTVNEPTTAYLRLTDLGLLDEDSTGATLRGNNTFYSLVIWGVVSEATGDSQLYCNLPSGSYGNATTVVNDSNRYSNFTIPTEFKGTGFLIARINLQYQTVASGTYTEVSTEDLRGLLPSTAAGSGGVSGGSEFSDNLFRLQNVSDVSKEIEFDLSAITTATTRTVTMPDSDVTLLDDPLTTKGDMLGFSTLPVRVPVGADGEILVADSGEASGVDWASALTGIDFRVGGTCTSNAGSLCRNTSTDALKMRNNANTAEVSFSNDTVNAATYAPIASPTFTGTVGAAAITATGVINGLVQVTLDTAATASPTCDGEWRYNDDNDAIDYTLPGAAAGLVCCFGSNFAAVVTVDPADGVDTITLNGTTLTAGNAIDSPGTASDFACLIGLDATRWKVEGKSGTWVDGGAD